MKNLFLVGGAKGVGKTTITSCTAEECGIERVETGKIVFDYIHKGLNCNLNDYITEQLFTWDRDLLVDTHFAAYPHTQGMDRKFKRGLDKKNLYDLSKWFDIYLCLIDLDGEELLRRRMRDNKERITVLEMVQEELEFNRKASEIYSKETKKPVLRLYNYDPNSTKRDLSSWINSNLLLQQQ